MLGVELKAQGIHVCHVKHSTIELYLQPSHKAELYNSICFLIRFLVIRIIYDKQLERNSNSYIRLEEITK